MIPAPEIDSHWPPMLIVLDGYEPRLAQIVIDTVREIRDERVFTVLWDAVCDAAYEGAEWN